jgi:hypothetical protein
VLQSLVDDGIVDTDKIGSGVYYWAFPSKSGQKRRARLDALNLDVEQKRLDRQRLTSERDRLLEGRQDTETRQSLLQRLSDLEQHSTKLRAQLCNLQGADPAEIDRLRSETRVGVEAANRWADNVDVLRKWAAEKFAISSSDFDKSFEIESVRTPWNKKHLGTFKF